MDLYRIVHRSLNLKHSLVLTGMFRFKPTNQFAERCHSVVGCALNVEDFILNHLGGGGIQYVTNKFLTYFSVYFTNRLTDFWAMLYTNEIQAKLY
jgi:hypothetical protein